MAFSLQINDQKFDEIFPFSFIINESMEIIKAGVSMRRLFPDIEGTQFNKILDIQRPTHARSSFDDLLGLTNQIIVLRTINHKNLLFRYGMISLYDNQKLLFVGSPWVTKSESLKDFGLKLKDFALHDAITDLLQVLTVKDIALEDVRKLNEQLETSEERFRLVVENAHDLIYYIDTSGAITYINKVVEEKSGYAEKEILGKHFLDFVEESYRQDVMDYYISARENKMKQSYFEFPIKSKEGKIIWLGQNVHANTDQSGNITSYFSVSRDITDQIALEEELRSAELRLRKLISNLQSGILVEDERRRIILVNQEFCNIFNIPASPSKLIGADCSDSAQQSKGLFKDPESFITSIDKALKKKEVIVGEEMTMVSGRIYERDYIPIFLDERYLGHLWQYRDITEQKLSQQKLIEARKEAEAAQEAEQQFLAKMSHEIRTPLNAVVGMSHLLSETRTTSEQKEYLEILSSSADLLQNLISDILDLSKITAGQVEVVNAPLDLKKILDSLYNSFRLKCTEKHVDLKYNIDPKLETDLVGDELLLNQILINLISNAVKFTSEGSISIEVDLVERFKDIQTTEICVRDTGIGISEQNLNAIFENFRQAHGEISRQYGGTGLGLAIVNQLVTLLSGSIKVESELGKGSCFTVQLPLRIDDHKVQHMKHYQIDEEIALDKLEILIAEDNVMNRKYISRLMEKWGVKFDIVFNGQEAVDAARIKKYNLILMDIQMPLKNGYEATDEIRKNQGPNQSSPIVALTASALTEHKHLADDMGMDGFISKPFRPEQLKDKLEEYARLVHIDLPGTERQIEGLDRSHLEVMYGDDKAYALEMFELFVEHVHPEYHLLRSHIEASEVEPARALLHKIIPSFSMVGLTSLGERLSEFKEMIKSSFDKEKAIMDLDALDKEFTACFPLVEEEISKLSS